MRRGVEGPEKTGCGPRPSRRDQPRGRNVGRQVHPVGKGLGKEGEGKEEGGGGGKEEGGGEEENGKGEGGEE